MMSINWGSPELTVALLILVLELFLAERAIVAYKRGRKGPPRAK